MIRRTALTLSMSAAVVAALLAAVVGCGGQSEGASTGGVVNLPFAVQHALPASARVDVPGSGKFKMALSEGRIESTRANAAGESLVEASTTLKIDGGAAVGKGQVLCSVHAEKGDTRIAVTSGGLSALYPRASEEGIYDQEVPATLLIRFPIDGDRLVELSDGTRPARFTSVRGVLLTWPKVEPGVERLRYRLPSRKSKGAIELPFFTVWRARDPSPFKVACTLAVATGTATVETEG
jgi:hypothetical protein